MDRNCGPVRMIVEPVTAPFGIELTPHSRRACRAKQRTERRPARSSGLRLAQGGAAAADKVASTARFAMSRRHLVTVAFLVSLAGCDQLGIESATATAARVEADGKAVGAACRHGGRAIEDCFALNRKTDKAAIYAGWREMDDYMRENKMEPVPATLAAAGARKSDDGAADDGAKPAAADKAADAKPAEKSDKLAKGDKAGKAKVEKTAAAESDKTPATH